MRGHKSKATMGKFMGWSNRNGGRRCWRWERDGKLSIKRESTSYLLSLTRQNFKVTILLQRQRLLHQDTISNLKTKVYYQIQLLSQMAQQWNKEITHYCASHKKGSYHFTIHSHQKQQKQKLTTIGMCIHNCFWTVMWWYLRGSV